VGREAFLDAAARKNETDPRDCSYAIVESTAGLCGENCFGCGRWLHSRSTSYAASLDLAPARWSADFLIDASARANASIGNKQPTTKNSSLAAKRLWPPKTAVDARQILLVAS
jgi:hypothetical protein